MVVLAMHIRRNRAADGHEFRARRDGRKPPARQEGGDHIAKDHARLCRQNAALRIEGQHAVELARRKRRLGV
jgi:hypothetical protein